MATVQQPVLDDSPDEPHERLDLHDARDLTSASATDRGPAVPGPGQPLDEDSGHRIAAGLVPETVRDRKSGAPRSRWLRLVPATESSSADRERHRSWQILSFRRYSDVVNL
jgi:hypothetical protein